MYGPSATGNYARAGAAGARETERIFQAAVQNSPDYSKIVQEAAVRTGRENIAALKAEEKLRRVGIREYGATKSKKELIDAEDRYKKSKRKAGILAAAGKLVGTGMAGLAPSDRKKRQVGSSSAALLERERKARAKADSIRNTELPELPTLTSNTSSNVSGDSGTSSDTSTPSNTGKPGGNTPTFGGGDLSMQYMSKLTNAGMSDEQAAAAVGHLIVETGGFKHMEELAPNRHGTKGYGHLQWTDPTPGRGRRTDFMNWAQQNNLDPQSFEANSGFLVHEMTTNFNQSWTGGGSFAGLQKQPNLQSASSYLQNNFIRPGIPHTERRLAEGYNVLEQWRKMNQN